MRNRLVIFARAPRPGRAKRRLAADIGPVAAARFQRLALERTVRRLAFDRRWETRLAVTGGPYRWPADVARIAQPRGDLGRRMDLVMRGLGPGPVVLVGSDIPDIEPRHIAAAFRALGRHDVVFGPAEDGGYWLVGFRRRPVMPAPFDPVRWSTRHALADTIANLGTRFDYALVDTLNDVDDGADYSRWLAGLHCT